MQAMRGFTLVELTLVVVIIGVLAVVAGPRFYDRQLFDERVFFEESLAAIRYAQTSAVASGCLVQVSLDGNGYHLRQAENCTVGAYTVDVPSPDDGSAFAGPVPNAVAVSTVNFPLVFDSLGRPSSAASATIGTVGGANGSGFNLSVSAETGLLQ